MTLPHWITAMFRKPVKPAPMPPYPYQQPAQGSGSTTKPTPAATRPPPVVVQPTPTPAPPAPAPGPVPVVVQPQGPSAPTITPAGQIDLENFEPTFAWDFRKQGLQLQKDGGPWRTTNHTDWQSNDPSVTGWRRRIQSTGDFPNPGDVLQFYVDDGLIPWSPFSFDALGDLVITSRRVDPAWLPKLWNWKGGWVSGMLNTGPKVAEGQFWNASVPAAFAQTFGYFEVEMRQDDVFSNWGAFWGVPADFMGSKAQELDIVEWINGNRVHPVCTVHGNGGEWVQRGADVASAEFIRFGAEWTADGFVQPYCNGVAYGDPLDVRPYNWVAPIHLILSLNVGAGRAWKLDGPPGAGVQSMSATFRNPRAYKRVKPRMI